MEGLCRSGRGGEGRWYQRTRLCGAPSAVWATRSTRYKVPSTPLNRLLGGVYVSMQLGQKSLTVSTPGRSERPQGTTRVALQNTLGQYPKCAFSCFECCDGESVSFAAPEVRECMYHLGESLPGDDITLVDEAVQELGGALDNGHIGNFERLLLW